MYLDNTDDCRRCWTASQLANILLWIAKMIWHHNLVSKFGKIAKRKVWELVGWWWGAEGDQVAEQCTMSIKLEGFYPPIYRAQESFQSIVQHKEAKIRILCNGKPSGQLQIIVFNLVATFEILCAFFSHISSKPDARLGSGNSKVSLGEMVMLLEHREAVNKCA